MYRTVYYYRELRAFRLLADVDIDAILTAVVWPVFAGIILILIYKYRQHIGPYLKDLKISKLSLGPFSVELAEAKGFEPDLKVDTAQGIYDFRNQSGIPIESDGKRAIIEQIKQEGNKDYAIFDLGDGNVWLTSRLFLFTVVLHHLYGLKSIVFLCTRDGVANHFLGIISPEGVREALGKKYPWLEEALANAYIEDWQSKHPNYGHTRPEHFGFIERSNATRIVTGFLGKIQAGIDQLDNYAKPEERSQWTLIREKWEHAEWVSEDKLETVLGEGLDKESWINESELRNRSSEGQILVVLSSKSRYVAVLDESRRFEKGRLIDKFSLAVESLRHMLMASR